MNIDDNETEARMKEEKTTRPFMKLSRDFLYSSAIRKLEKEKGELEKAWYLENLLKMEFYLVLEKNEVGSEGFFPDDEEALDQMAFDIHYGERIPFKDFLNTLSVYGFVERRIIEGIPFLYFPRVVKNQMEINYQKSISSQKGKRSGEVRRQNKQEDTRPAVAPLKLAESS